MLFYGCIAVSFALGILSNFVRPKWSVLVFVLVVYAGVVRDSWRYIDLQRESVWQAIWRTAVQGTFWYLIPSLLFGGLPFLAGRYGYQLVAKMVLRSGCG
jgi:hypothetical protein